jgi:hypothetical protein
MNLDDLEGRILSLAAEVKGQLRTEMETVAQTGLAIVTQRVSEEGRNASGQPFKPYTKEYEAYKRQAVGGKASAKKRKERATAKATPDIPQGRYRGIVDFTLTGQMLSSIGLVETTETADGVKVLVTGRDEFTRAKMQGNDNYRPGWFRLSDKEIVTIADQSAVRWGRFVETFLNA